MHDRLTDILGEEVVGEIFLKDDVPLDAGLGRVCLQRLDPPAIEDLLSRLREEFNEESMQVRDRLHLEDASKLVRGLVEVNIVDPPGGSPYLLQISTEPLLAFYERRFMVETGVQGNLMGTLCLGLGHTFARGVEVALREISEYDALERNYVERLDAVLQASLAGSDVDPAQWVGELREMIRSCWKLLPWPLRSQMQPVPDLLGEDRFPHQGGSNNTVILTANIIDGVLVFEYTHKHNELEEYREVLGWMSEVRLALSETYTPPEHETALARASSVQVFLDHYPGFKSIIT